MKISIKQNLGFELIEAGVLPVHSTNDFTDEEYVALALTAILKKSKEMKYNSDEVREIMADIVSEWLQKPGLTVNEETDGIVEDILFKFCVPPEDYKNGYN